MLKTARVLIRIVCIFEFGFALIALVISAMPDSTNKVGLAIVGLVLFVHAIISLVIASSMTWFVTGKQVAFLLVSGFVFLCANAIDGLFVNPLLGAIFIIAGLIGLMANMKSKQDEKDIQNEKDMKASQ